MRSIASPLLPLEPPPGALSVAGESGFDALDALVQSQGARGFVEVEGDRTTLLALPKHLERRLRTVGREAVVIGLAQVDDAWRALATRLSAAASDDPQDVARAIASALGDGALVIVEGEPTQWGRSVSVELARHLRATEARALCLVLREARAAASPFADARGAGLTHRIAIDPQVSSGDARAWWDAVAADPRGGVPPVADLGALERWWSLARSLSADARPSAPSRSAGARALLARLSLARRPWPASEIGRLGDAAAVDELLRSGAIELAVDGTIAAIAHDALTSLSDASDVADALLALAPADPWALTRAAELSALAGQPARAEASMAEALSQVTDAGARADFWDRWERVIAALDDDGATGRLLRSAELALQVGDTDRSLDFAHAAAARAGDTYDVMLTLGRATTARGDLTTAAIALQKAMDRAPNAADRGRAAVEMAELLYASGQLEDARRCADEVLATAVCAPTRLAARNVLGKLLLASASWAEAERHFATDACEATCASDFVGELRARLNRAIALLSSGRRDEAWSMLVSVLEEGERRGELRAAAFARANLATIATDRHDYAQALDLWVSAIDALRRFGDKLRLTRLITNLAELRLRLGLVSEAEQALSFARSACGPGVPDARFSQLAIVAARIHLARGRTLEAASEIKAALAAAGASSHGTKLSECHRLAARVAFEDGDLARVESSLEGAEIEAATDYARAEVAVLRAMLARARGEDFDDAARVALELSRGVDDDFAQEAHLLLHHAAVLQGEPRGARGHLRAALAIRDRVASSLDGPLRASYLARRELAELAAIEAEQARSADEPEVAATSRRDEGRSGAKPLPAAMGKIVGDAPAMRALATAIRKVAATDATVLVFGESGTGKELVADAIHTSSPRRSAPFVKVNCSALVETLLLSELFGHEKGSFTGASARRRGRFEMAEGGTLFLDEIGDISPRTQVALLRVLQEKTFERVGGTTPLHADVRVICATHRDLPAMVARGEFREDLYYRLQGMLLVVPPLRERLCDLPLIAEAILARAATEAGAARRRLAPTAIDALGRHAWPGNVRELENALRAAALFAESDVLEIADFTNNVAGLSDLEDQGATEPQTVRAGAVAAPAATGSAGGWRPSGTRPAAAAFDAGEASKNEPESVPVLTDVAYASVRGGISLFDMKRQIEHDCIARALEESGGNITRAAVLLGMKRPRLSQLVKQYGLGNGSEES